MFLSHDKNINKKKFQKPNILRRKANFPSVKLTITAGSGESSEAKTINIPINANDSHTYNFLSEKIPKSKNEGKSHRTSTGVISPHEPQISCAEGNKFEVNAKNYLQSFGASTLNDSHEESDYQNSVNVESFLVSGVSEENLILHENNDLLPPKTDLQGNKKWCFNFIRNPTTFIVEESEPSQIESIYVDNKPDTITNMVPLSAVSMHHKGAYIVPAEQISDELTLQKLSVEQFFARSHKFKCDVPDCDKEFMSEQKLNKHKNTHNKDGITRVVRHTTAECPVKKIHEDGTEEPCGRIFQIRDELVKHLNEEHNPEDANYRCEECGRRFFWASGLRGHARTHRTRRPRAALACAWPGCGRVFRQPCRLREHTRAHTGDKPYPCRYPNCGWSFRTASKLERHARRHTGERRHACPVCGRAFLRREHLRDHTRRHHRHHNECEQTITNTSSLDMPVNKIHSTDEDPEIIEAAAPDDTQHIMKTDSIFMVYMPETNTATEVKVEGDGAALTLSEGASDVEEDAVVGGVVEDDGLVVHGEHVTHGVHGEGHAARTHCTWPLGPRAHVFQQADAYVLEEDGQVEHSEISESNIYTVRSDLFLHGNILTNEDSEHMAGERAGCAEGSLDAELMLAPSVDLAQEELYTDAVDESSFRVFLLSGEDLA